MSNFESELRSLHLPENDTDRSIHHFSTFVHPISACFQSPALGMCVLRFETALRLTALLVAFGVFDRTRVVRGTILSALLQLHTFSSYGQSEDSSSRSA